MLHSNTCWHSQRLNRNTNLFIFASSFFPANRVDHCGLPASGGPVDRLTRSNSSWECTISFKILRIMLKLHSSPALSSSPMSGKRVANIDNPQQKTARHWIRIKRTKLLLAPVHMCAGDRFQGFREWLGTDTEQNGDPKICRA